MTSCSCAAATASRARSSAWTPGRACDVIADGQQIQTPWRGRRRRLRQHGTGAPAPKKDPRPGGTRGGGPRELTSLQFHSRLEALGRSKQRRRRRGDHGARADRADGCDGRAVYLSELAPLRYVHTPLLGVRRPLGADASAAGRLLRVGHECLRQGRGAAAADAASRIGSTENTPGSRRTAGLTVRGEQSRARLAVLVDGQGASARRGQERTAQDPPLPVLLGRARRARADAGSRFRQSRRRAGRRELGGRLGCSSAGERRGLPGLAPREHRRISIDVGEIAWAACRTMTSISFARLECDQLHHGVLRELLDVVCFVRPANQAAGLPLDTQVADAVAQPRFGMKNSSRSSSVADAVQGHWRSSGHHYRETAEKAHLSDFARRPGMPAPHFERNVNFEITRVQRRCQRSTLLNARNLIRTSGVCTGAADSAGCRAGRGP